MATSLQAVCALALSLAFVGTSVIKRDTACAASHSCPKPGGGCVPLNETYELSHCSKLTCTVESSVYWLRGTMGCAISNGNCVNVGQVYSFNACTNVTCTFSNSSLIFKGTYNCAHGDPLSCYGEGTNMTIEGCKHRCVFSGNTIGFMKVNSNCE
ncbi:uncharacterized protein [Haliotis cracherodii]|uniref:uncharacterized protein n=1 Tax=Haliotis cracherodii TaxID=6455 RepID=UPI0039ED68F1